MHLPLRPLKNLACSAVRQVHVLHAQHFIPGGSNAIAVSTHSARCSMLCGLIACSWFRGHAPASDHGVHVPVDMDNRGSRVRICRRGCAPSPRESPRGSNGDAVVQCIRDTKCLRHVAVSPVQ